VWFISNHVVSRKHGVITLHLVMSNKGVSPLANLKMIFNKNSYALRIELDSLNRIGVLDAGAVSETSIPVSTDGVQSPMIPINSMFLMLIV
jgi:hypothetical protein